MHNGATGFGVNGGASGGEIDIGESAARRIRPAALRRRDQGPVSLQRPRVQRQGREGRGDGRRHDLHAVRAQDADDAAADWTGPGTVSKCGATTATGTGCFLIENPFPGTVSTLAFQALAGGSPLQGSGSSNSDYSIGFIDVAAQTVVELQDCADADGLPGRDRRRDGRLQPEFGAGRQPGRQHRGARDPGAVPRLPVRAAGLPRPAAARRRLRGERRCPTRHPHRPRRHPDPGSVRPEQAEPGRAGAQRHAPAAGRSHLAVRRERHAARRTAAPRDRAPVARPVGQ